MSTLEICVKKYGDDIELLSPTSLPMGGIEKTDNGIEIEFKHDNRGVLYETVTIPDKDGLYTKKTKPILRPYASPT